MCGITGIIREAGKAARSGVIKKMTKALVHRGPDADGFYVAEEAALGMRRLSIIDIAGGVQPMHSPCGRYHIVFNGEIYNHTELRKDLEKAGTSFRTRSDTEVILQAYRLKGPKCLDDFNGMFAIAIWDSAKKELFLARDRLGVKPCYYSFLPDGTFLFASEIKALQMYPGFRSLMNPSALEHLLTFGFPLCPETFLKDVSQVLPGHYLMVTLDKVEEKKYWDLDPSRKKLDLSSDELAEGLLEKLNLATKRRLVSDVPVSAYLSGGLIHPSSLVCILV